MNPIEIHDLRAAREVAPAQQAVAEISESSPFEAAHRLPFVPEGHKCAACTATAIASRCM